MKNLEIFFLVAVAVLLFLGFMTQLAPQAGEPEVTENVTEEVTEDVTEIAEEITPEEGAVIETYMIKSVNGRFPTTDYPIETGENPFSDMAGGDLGKTSTAYVRVNENDLNFLRQYDYCGTEEYQSMWFTPMISKEKGSIFEAVYLAEFGGCGLENPEIHLFGKEYEVLEMNLPSEQYPGKIVRGGSLKLKGPDGEILTLVDGQGFNNDDRWPVVLGWQNGELRKIIVYMGGYFYDVEEDKGVVPLFGAGNRVLAKFRNVGGDLAFELITTDMTEGDS